jgi:nucleotide-binding universal stress UspA family protein
MLAMRKILVPVDFSDRATAAARHAVALAERFRTPLLFAHVIPPAPPEYAGFEGGYYAARFGPVTEDGLRRVERQLQELAAQAAGASPFETVVREGDPGREIARLAEESRADLIVMPTHGYGPFRRFVLGSVTAKVLHDCECPVFTGTHVEEISAGVPGLFHRIAVAVDLGPHSEKVLRWAACFGEAYNSELVLVHAAPSLEVSGQYMGAEWRSTLVQMATDEAGKLLQKAECQAELWIDSGDVTKYVPAAVTASGAGLLVIGRSVHQGLLGRLRTNAYALIRESPVPVISV